MVKNSHFTKLYQEHVEIGKISFYPTVDMFSGISSLYVIGNKINVILMLLHNTQTFKQLLQINVL
jgi:hypothetical protein